MPCTNRFFPVVQDTFMSHVGTRGILRGTTRGRVRNTRSCPSTIAASPSTNTRRQATIPEQHAAPPPPPAAIRVCEPWPPLPVTAGVPVVTEPTLPTPQPTSTPKTNPTQTSTNKPTHTPTPALTPTTTISTLTSTSTTAPRATTEPARIRKEQGVEAVTSRRMAKRMKRQEIETGQLKQTLKTLQEEVEKLKKEKITQQQTVMPCHGYYTPPPQYLQLPSPQPAYLQPAHPQPAHTLLPAHTQLSAHTQLPAYPQPTYPQPTYAQSTYAQPTYSQPGYPHLPPTSESAPLNSQSQGGYHYSR